MVQAIWILLSVLGTASVLIWLAILFHPARPWDFQPVGEDLAAPPEPAAWPPVVALVPARNEAAALPRTLPALLAQDYPGDFHVVVIDDRSEDETAGTARRVAREGGRAERLTVLAGAPLPAGWVGKVWALHQGASQAPPAANAAYLWLTDADIRHAPGSLRRLVAESEQAGLALNSRMARLRCASAAERLLIPPFVFFFNLLYPMRRVNNPRDPLAAAAGGCVLLRREALSRAGGFAALKGEVIDDVNLARRIKGPGAPIRLALSRRDVESLRAYDSLASIWRMVRRTAFTELKHSWLRLAATVAGLGVMFLVPPLLLASGLALAFCTAAAIPSGLAVPVLWPAVLAVKGLVAWAAMAVVFRPATAFFGLGRAWAWTLPLGGLLYGAIVCASAWRHLRRAGLGWR